MRKVKPLFRVQRVREPRSTPSCGGIDYVVDECPNAVGATQLVYKDMLNRLEAASPGSKLTFVQDFLSRAQPGRCRPTPTGRRRPACSCGMPAFGEVCGFCRLVREAETKRDRRAAAGAA